MMDAVSKSKTQPTIITIPDSQRKKIRLALLDAAEKALTGKSFEISVQLINNSEQGISSEYPNRVFLSYHWLDDAGNYAPYEGWRTPITRIIPSGGTDTLEVNVKPPTVPGQFVLQVGLLQEQVSWFESGDLEHLLECPIQVLDGTQQSLRDLKCIPRYAQDRSVQVDTAPAIFSFELTNHCPFKCIMCARTNNMTRTEGYMAFATFSKAVDELVDSNPGYARDNEVMLHGFGESLVHPEFEKFLAYANRKGLNTAMSINPLMLTKKVAAQLLDNPPAHLYIALDGHDDESFEKIRGVKNAYVKSKRRLLKYLREKERRGVKTKITLSMIDFPDNRGSINGLESFWNDHDGIDEFIAKPFVTWDGKAEDVNILSLTGKKVVPTESKVLCDFPWSKMTVSWDGDLVPCCFDYNKRYALGNINKESLEDIWNGERMHALRAELISNKVTNPLCHGCEYLYQDIVPEV